jgi:hypothetical protein
LAGGGSVDAIEARTDVPLAAYSEEVRKWLAGGDITPEHTRTMVGVFGGEFEFVRFSQLPS